MNKTVKGALAAGTAAVLLMGGASTLAYWNAEDTVAGTTIGSGDLQLDASSCDTAGWKVSNTVEGVSDAAFAPGTDTIVPGDTLTKTCTVAITADGENLRATLGVTGGGESGSMAADDYTVDSTFTLNDAALTEITEANDGQTIEATITVDFPLGSTVDNDSKLKNITLSDYTVTATQATGSAA